MLPELNYEQLKVSYSMFKKELPKDDFSRWYIDMQYLDSLIEFAKKANLESDVVEFQAQKNKVCDELKKLGYEIES